MLKPNFWKFEGQFDLKDQRHQFSKLSKRSEMINKQFKFEGKNSKWLNLEKL